MKDKCKIANKIIDEISENDKDKSKLLDKLGLSLLIFSGTFGLMLGFLIGEPISKYIKEKYTITKND